MSKQKRYPSINVSNKYESKNLPSLKNLEIGFVIRNAIAKIIARL